MRIKFLLAALVGLNLLFIAASCRSNTSQNMKGSKHDAELKSNAGHTIYIDRVPNTQVLKSELSDTGLTSLCSFKVGFEDSAVYSQKQNTEWGIYFNYEMQKNWVLLINGDSVFPVFFQPLIKKTPKLDEGIIIFEVAKGSVPDTMIYKDRFDNHIEIFKLKK